MVENESGAPGILSNFDHCRLLIVENGFFLDDETERLLQQLGAQIERVDGEHQTPPEEFASFDAAIIDIGLSAEETFAWAERLDESGIPYVFATNLQENGGERRFHPFRLCADLEELEVIALRLFGVERIN